MRGSASRSATVAGSWSRFSRTAHLTVTVFVSGSMSHVRSSTAPEKASSTAGSCPWAAAGAV